MNELRTQYVGAASLARSRSWSLAAYEALKSLMDRGGALAAIVILTPLFLVVAAVIKLDSRGPIFFRQRRIGRDGAPFTIYKFRTMFHHCEPYAPSPANDDPTRVTRVGRWMRERGLDELPQLLCVLKGDMSLVGPRPEMPFLVAGYTPWQRQRLSVRPGITGYWQLAASHRQEPIHANLGFDLHYLEHRSLGFDLWILWQSLRVPLGLRIRLRDEAP